MNCNELRENLFELVSEEKPNTEASAHLSQCPACAGELDSMRKTMALMDGWEAPEPSAYYDSRLRARLREVQAEEAGNRGGILAWLRRPALAGSLAAVLIVGGLMLRPSNSGNPDSSGDNAGSGIVQAEAGTAVGDLQGLEEEGDLYAEIDILDVIATDDEVMQ